jgi:hypothetical protein
MIRGLQITMRGDDFKKRTAERLRMHEEKASALDERIEFVRMQPPYVQVPSARRTATSWPT